MNGVGGSRASVSSLATKMEPALGLESVPTLQQSGSGSAGVPRDPQHSRNGGYGHDHGRLLARGQRHERDDNKHRDQDTDVDSDDADADADEAEVGESQSGKRKRPMSVS